MPLAYSIVKEFTQGRLLSSDIEIFLLTPIMNFIKIKSFSLISV